MCLTDTEYEEIVDFIVNLSSIQLEPNGGLLVRSCSLENWCP